MLDLVARDLVVVIDLNSGLVESFAPAAARIGMVSATSEGHLGRRSPSSAIVGGTEQI